MRRLKALAVVALSAVPLGTAPMAHADPLDRGNGSVHCARGEICFTNGVPPNGDQTNPSSLRHFYWDADHRKTRYSNGMTFHSSVHGYRNLDTACTVYVWTAWGPEASALNWYVYSVLGSEAQYFPTGTISYRRYSDADRNRNLGHTRCGSSTPPIGR